MIDSVTRIKKTRQIVQKVGPADSMHTWCLFPLDKPSKKGNRAVLQSVKNDNLVTDRES